MIFQNLFRAGAAKTETSLEAPASENQVREMQVLSTDELREVAGGPEIQNQNQG
jgi:hypothetical protein